nr:hypothetical protein Itr_chr04CG19690 [Ipomoea trifida]
MLTPNGGERSSAAAIRHLPILLSTTSSELCWQASHGRTWFCCCDAGETRNATTSAAAAAWPNGRGRRKGVFRSPTPLSLPNGEEASVSLLCRFTKPLHPAVATSRRETMPERHRRRLPLGKMQLSHYRPMLCLEEGSRRNHAAATSRGHSRRKSRSQGSSLEYDLLEFC